MPRETWGLLIDWIGNEFADAMVRAIQDECRKRDCRLVAFTLGPLSYQLDEPVLADQILPFLNLPGIDRLLIGSSQLLRNGGDRKLARLLARGRPRPMVSLGGRIEKVPMVSGEHGPAFRALLGHLWQVHGCRRYAWVGGPPDNPVAAARRAIFLDFLTSHGASLSPVLDQPGNFNLAAGREAGYRLSHLREEFDVVVAANDAMALGVREILGNVAVTGIDNSPAAAAAGLTTVDTGLPGEILAALDLLSRAMPGAWPEPAGLTVQAGALVVRSSCGCPAEATTAAGTVVPAADGGHLAERVGTLFENILESRDMSELTVCLNRALPAENIGFWRFLPPIEGGQGGQSQLDIQAPDGGDTSDLVIHSLFRDKELYGYFAHDLTNRDYALSEWLRINLCLALQAWQREGSNLQVQGLLKSEIEKHNRRQRDIERVVDSLPVWILELDRRLVVRYANRQMRQLLGPGPENDPPWSFLARVDPVDRPAVEQRLQAALKTRQASNADFRLRAAGRSIPLMAEVRPLADDGRSSLSALKGALHGSGGLRLAGLDLESLVGGIVQPEDLLLKHFDFGPREQELIRLLARGLDGPDIARRMGTAPSTVRVQLHHIYLKSGVGSRKEFLGLLADYHARTQSPHSLTRILLARLLHRS